MGAAELITGLQADGLRLAVTPDGGIRVEPRAALTDEHRTTIRAHRAAIIAALQQAANDPAAVHCGNWGQSGAATMSAADEQAILAWLASIGETDPATIGDVIGRCRADADARGYYLMRAAAGSRAIACQAPEAGGAVAATDRIGRVIAKLERDPGLRYAIETHPEAEPGVVILALAIRGKGACELSIPAATFDPFALLALIEQHTRARQ